jgi:hypothetical protein
MANFEYKQAVMRLVFEAGITEEGEMKFTSKTYRNLRPSATADQLLAVSDVLAGFSAKGYIGAERVQTMSIQ